MDIGSTASIANYAERIEKLEEASIDTASSIGRLWDTAIEHAKHIEKLEAVVLPVSGLTAIETTKALGRRVEKLEAALRDVVRCLIDGRVSVAGAIPGELHGHRVLGIESVQAMVEVYHRVKE